jgi:hypothetical protein
MNQPPFVKTKPVDLSQPVKLPLQPQLQQTQQTKEEFKDEFQLRKEMQSDIVAKQARAAQAIASAGVESQIDKVNQQLSGIDGSIKDQKIEEELSKLDKKDFELAEQLIFKGFAITEVAPTNFPDHKYSICSQSPDDISLVDEMVFEYVKSKEDEKTGSVDLPEANVRAFRNVVTLALCYRGMGDKDICEIAIHHLSTIKRGITKCKELELTGDLSGLKSLKTEVKQAVKHRAAKISALPTAIIDFISQSKFEFDSKMYTIMTTKGIYPKS